MTSSSSSTTSAAAPALATAADAGSITVAIVDNPTMKDIQTLTPANFTKETGIKVNYVSLNEQTLREQVTKSVGSGVGGVWKMLGMLRTSMVSSSNGRSAFHACCGRHRASCSAMPIMAGVFSGERVSIH